jgi:amino acid adenylation domain-containing protein
VIRLAEESHAEAADLGAAISGSDLAYVIYTSGSTGQPKGVMLEHGGLAQHIVDVTARFGLAPGDRILQFAAYTFDQGLEQVLTTLTLGGTLILRGEEIWPPADFPAVIRDYGLNAINLPPAYWNQVLMEWTAAPNKVEIPAGQVKTIISGGDVLTPESLRLWQQTPVARARLINAYGPTETTITACAFDTPSDWHERTARAVPIGRPLPNRVAYVVDAHGAATPIGVPGELWLGGTGVARGYLNRDALTAEKFVGNPFKGDERADRLYRTGDLVRLLRDGKIEFMGRLDEQVKVRGFRIELSEVEAALREHGAVADAAVVARDEPGSGEKRLIAFVVAREGREDGLNARDLRAFAGEKLPGYMIPAAFALLPALPLTPSGKVDRKALKVEPLPEPDTAYLTGERYVAPRTPLEEEIAAVWAEVLGAVSRGGVPRVGINDNFFDLGGHSLLATQIVSRLRARYPVDLPLRRLFEAPTVAGLAALIEEALLNQQNEDELAELLAELDGLDEDDV